MNVLRAVSCCQCRWIALPTFCPHRRQYLLPSAPASSGHTRRSAAPNTSSRQHRRLRVRRPHFARRRALKLVAVHHDDEIIEIGKVVGYVLLVLLTSIRTVDPGHIDEDEVETTLGNGFVDGHNFWTLDVPVALLDLVLRGHARGPPEALVGLLDFVVHLRRGPDLGLRAEELS